MGATAMENKEDLTLTQAAAYLGISVDTLRKRIREYSIPKREEGRNIYILKDDLEAYKTKRRQEGGKRQKKE